MKKFAGFIALGIMLLILFFLSVNLGGLQVSPSELFRGIFIAYDKNVSIIWDLRFPRIIIALLAGASMAVSGVLFQAVMKNPLADPGIIGVSSGAGFAAMLVTLLFPSLYFISPVFAFVGGIVAFMLIYGLSWSANLNPLRLILVGIAVNAVFTGLIQAISYMTGGTQSGVASIVNANITMKTWDDVQMLAVYAIVGLMAACFVTAPCNMLLLEDKTIWNLGVNVTRMRVFVSVIAVLLASITTAVAGVIGFVGLIGPHIGRLFVGSDHKALIPFSLLLGSFIVLLADTVGRMLLYPLEIPASIVMAVAGGPFFIFLLIRSGRHHGN